MLSRFTSSLSLSILAFLTVISNKIKLIDSNNAVSSLSFSSSRLGKNTGCLIFYVQNYGDSGDLIEHLRTAVRRIENHLHQLGCGLYTAKIGGINKSTRPSSWFLFARWLNQRHDCQIIKTNNDMNDWTIIILNLLFHDFDFGMSGGTCLHSSANVYFHQSLCGSQYTLLLNLVKRTSAFDQFN